jgi:ATP-binding cassette, subfamily B (MDR/TAP), member 1
MTRNLSVKEFLIRWKLSFCDVNVKVAVVTASLAAFFTAFVIAFVKNWKFAFILSCILPTIITIFVIGGGFMAKYAKLVMAEYGNASTIAEEIISSVRTAQAFGTQKKLAKLYDDNLVAAQRAGYKQQLAGAFMLAAMFFSIYAFYGLGFCIFSEDVY